MTHKIIGSVGILLATLLAFAQPALAQVTNAPPAHAQDEPVVH